MVSCRGGWTHTHNSFLGLARTTTWGEQGSLVVPVQQPFGLVEVCYYATNAECTAQGTRIDI